MDYPKFDPLELLEQAAEQIRIHAHMIQQLTEHHKFLRQHIHQQNKELRFLEARIQELERAKHG